MPYHTLFIQTGLYLKSSSISNYKKWIDNSYSKAWIIISLILSKQEVVWGYFFSDDGSCDDKQPLKLIKQIKIWIYLHMKLTLKLPHILKKNCSN